jgi:hypothetical protein
MGARLLTTQCDHSLTQSVGTEGAVCGLQHYSHMHKGCAEDDSNAKHASQQEKSFEAGSLPERA